MPKTKKKSVEITETSKTPEVEEEVVSVISTAKQEYIAYLEDMKRHNPHEYMVREKELINRLNQL